MHKAIRDWGIPIQYSIFEVEVNPRQLAQLLEELTGLIDTQEDKVMFYRLSPNQDRISLGVAVQTEDLLFV